MRMEEINATKADIVAVGCPQCTAMLEGVVGPRPEVLDIAELVAAQLVAAPAPGPRGEKRVAEEVAA